MMLLCGSCDLLCTCCYVGHAILLSDFAVTMQVMFLHRGVGSITDLVRPDTPLYIHVPTPQSCTLVSAKGMLM